MQEIKTQVEAEVVDQKSIDEQASQYTNQIIAIENGDHSGKEDIKNAIEQYGLGLQQESAKDRKLSGRIRRERFPRTVSPESCTDLQLGAVS